MSQREPDFKVCVFLGSNPGTGDDYRELASGLGREIARRGHGLVYGGAQVGLMGVLADAVLDRGGWVSGVIPQGLARKEVVHHGLSHLEVVDSMHERKRRMAELADAFVALPGGLGTLEEICEVVTWAQLGIHAKACGLLNAARYYDSLLAFLDHAAGEGFVRREHRELILVEETVEALLDRIEAHRPTRERRWLEPTQV